MVNLMSAVVGMDHVLLLLQVSSSNSPSSHYLLGLFAIPGTQLDCLLLHEVAMSPYCASVMVLL